jgi:hypothetical protein
MVTFTRPLHWLLLLTSLALSSCGPVPAPTTAPSALTSTPGPGATPIPTTVAPTAASPRPSPSPSATTRSRLTLLVDAEAALNRRDVTTALRLYRQAATDDSLADPTLDGRSTGPNLRDFASFRIVLLDAIVGQDDDARAVLDQLRGDGDRPFAGLTLVFWDTYGMTADLAAACRQVNQLVRDAPDRFLPPLNAGTNGLGLTPDSVCTVVSPG